MTLPPNWLEEARAKCDVSLGPWTYEHSLEDYPHYAILADTDPHGPLDEIGQCYHEAIAKFVCGARTALPAALDEIARLQGVVADAVRLLFNASPTCGSMFTPGARWQEQRDAFIAEHRAAFDAVYGPEAQHGEKP